jgi:hypothetical protein
MSPASLEHGIVESAARHRFFIGRSATLIVLHKGIGCKLQPNTYAGLARNIYIRCTYGILGREITKYTVIYGVYIRFWPTQHICMSALQRGEVAYQKHVCT